MKIYRAIAFATLSGAIIGGSIVKALHAQGKPPAYAILDIDVTDEQGYRQAAKDHGPEIAKLITDGGGKYIARGGKVVTIEGAPAKRLVIAAFDSLEKAEAMFSSTAYKTARSANALYANYRILAVEGVPQ
jgi:uncharacterized protein (DUF1330 family)